MEYPINSEILNAQSLQQTKSVTGTYLLPQAFPEGCPLHPSYGSGHATVAGATITLLKAWYDGSFIIPQPVQPSTTGESLTPYIGLPLTVHGELQKLASNIAQGRCIAGVHWRSDSDVSLVLGEEVAIALLREQKHLFNENSTLTFRKFDGHLVTI